MLGCAAATASENLDSFDQTIDVFGHCSRRGVRAIAVLLRAVEIVASNV